MKITNKFNVPDTLVALANNDTYTKGKADFSVTEIISPPRVQRLRRKYWNEMESDVSDMLWQLLGSALHVVAERGQADDCITEERLYVEVDGVTLSGAIDIQKITPEGIIITDYKFTSAWALRQDKFEWAAQQNIYAWMVNKAKGQKVIGIQICALIRDWVRREAQSKPDYPQAPIQVINLPLWELEKTEEYVRTRIDSHRESKVADDFDLELPFCTEDEKWIRETKYAVKKEGRKTAVKLFDEPIAAGELAQEVGGFVEIRKGEAVRCTGNFCGVSQWCSQYQATLTEGETSE